MKRRPAPVIAVLTVLFIIAIPVAAYAASLTFAMHGGDTATVTCDGTRVNSTRVNATTLRLNCRAPSPSPTQTSPSPSPSPSPSSSGGGGGFSCTTSSPSGNCGPYSSSKITNSNGYNTYVGNNCWADPSCTQTVRANGPDDWQVTAKEPAGNGAVMTYPDVQQLTNNWNGSNWGCSPCGFADTPLGSLSALSSSYAETMPGNGTGTIAQAAWDIWVSNSGANSNEIMVWVDNTNRDPEDAGATFDSQQTIAGQTWSLYFYGGHGGETIWSLGARHAAAQQHAGTVDLLALWQALVGKGYQASNAVVGQIDFGWEVCSTGGVARDFTVTDFSMTLST